MPIFLLRHAYFFTPPCLHALHHAYGILRHAYEILHYAYGKLRHAYVYSAMPLRFCSLGEALLCYAYKNGSRGRRASSAILHHAYRVQTTSFCFFSFENISQDRITPESLHVPKAIFSLAVKSLSRLLEAECRQRVSTRTG